MESSLYLFVSLFKIVECVRLMKIPDFFLPLITTMREQEILLCVFLECWLQTGYLSFFALLLNRQFVAWSSFHIEFFYLAHTLFRHGGKKYRTGENDELPSKVSCFVVLRNLFGPWSFFNACCCTSDKERKKFLFFPPIKCACT